METKKMIGIFSSNQSFWLSEAGVVFWIINVGVFRKTVAFHSW